MGVRFNKCIHTNTISLRIRHPDSDLAYIDQILNLESDRVWKAGDRRSTPKGTMLDGNYKDSYWNARITDPCVKSEVCNLENMLSDWNENLGLHRKELEKIITEGGSIEYFIWIYCERNLGFELNNTLIKDIADLGLKISIVCDPWKTEQTDEEGAGYAKEY